MPEPRPIIPVILCGGAGTRLWPLSRAGEPKQFGRILGERSLFQATLARLPEPAFGPPVVVTGAAFRFVVTEQLAAIGRAAQAVLVEPQARNTAPAVLAAALSVAESAPDALLLVCPSDHVIADAAAFQAAVHAARPAAEAGALVTFGVRPTRAETGYGYLELEGETAAGTAPLPLRRFVEKPDVEAAAAMLADGRHLWNSGIFLFSVTAILAAFARHRPELEAALREALEGARADLGFLRLAAEPYARIEAISLDYAVMEKAGPLAVVPLEAGWSDMGSWDAIAQAMGADAHGTALAGPAHAIDCEASVLRAEDPDQVLVGIGLKGIIAVAMRDAVLVADRSQGQRVREAVALLKDAGAHQAVAFPRVHRPWGWYETLSRGHRFQVKRIMVAPGGCLSLQSHLHRAEHWVVVEGTARVTVGPGPGPASEAPAPDPEVRLLGENQSVYIPLGAVHRLENPGRLELHLIEVQSGPYLGEDDITRYEDIYARDD